MTPEQAEILSHMSLIEIAGEPGEPTKAISFTGVEVEMSNGLYVEKGVQTTSLTSEMVIINSR